MSTTTSARAAPIKKVSPHTREFHEVASRAARAWWLRDRGVAEIRWAAITLAAIALLGVGATWLDPVSGDFLAAIALATPVAIVLGALGWSPAAARLGASRIVRRLLGPIVVLVACLSCGPADMTTLVRPPAASLVVLALAYAAMTPGYGLAAAIVIGVSGATLAANGQVVAVTGFGSPTSDEFTVGLIVSLLASGGIAVVVRVATDAEARATRQAARSRERVDALETVNRIVSRFDGSQAVNGVIQGVVDDVASEFEIALVSIYLPTGERGTVLGLVGVAGYQDPIYEIEVGVGVLGRAGQTLETQFVPDVLADIDYWAARNDVRSEVAAPIVHNEELLGVVNFEGTVDSPIGPAQVALAEMIAHALSAALRSARLDDERRERLHAIERVLAVSRDMVADLDRGRIVASIVDAVQELLKADTVGLFARQDDGVYRLEAGLGFPDDAFGVEVHGHLGLVSQAVATHAPVEGLQQVGSCDSPFLASRPGGNTPHAAMALPILLGDDVVAALFVSRIGGERRYSTVESAIAELLTAQVAIALNNADLHARVADSALRDPLTGLLNRRFFDEAVETAYAHARRHGAELSLLVLDLDRFSAVNNEHGHAIGDSVLRAVAGAITSAVREGDVVVRYGGEEFVVIAPATADEGAVAVAERIREGVARASLELFDGRYIPLTISAGVASLVDESDGHALFRAADSALLAAKRGGRDRVTLI